MKKYLNIIILILACSLSFSQEKNIFSNHQLAVDFGSFRNRYLYPITDIKYSSPILKKANLKISARLRSYGTLYFYSNSAYDLTPWAEYYFSGISKPVFFSVSFGFDARLRFVKEERSEARSSVEPIMSFAVYGNYKKFSFNMPLWTRFYSNGISFTVLPEVSFKAGKNLGLFVRYELSYLSIYKMQTHEWRRDSFFGAHILF